MPSVLLYTGIVLVAVPLILMVGFAAFIFFAFMKDDEMTAGIVKVGFIIMGIGALLVAGHFIQIWLSN